MSLNIGGGVPNSGIGMITPYGVLVRVVRVDGVWMVEVTGGGGGGQESGRSPVR